MVYTSDSPIKKLLVGFPMKLKIFFHHVTYNYNTADVIHDAEYICMLPGSQQDDPPFFCLVYSVCSVLYLPRIYYRRSLTGNSLSLWRLFIFRFFFSVVRKRKYLLPNDASGDGRWKQCFTHFPQLRIYSSLTSTLYVSTNRILYFPTFITTRGLLWNGRWYITLIGNEAEVVFEASILYKVGSIETTLSENYHLLVTHFFIL